MSVLNNSKTTVALFRQVLLKCYEYSYESLDLIWSVFFYSPECSVSFLKNCYQYIYIYLQTTRTFDVTSVLPFHKFQILASTIEANSVLNQSG